MKVHLRGIAEIKIKLATAHTEQSYIPAALSVKGPKSLSAVTGYLISGTGTA